MTDLHIPHPTSVSAVQAHAPRKRPKPGERKVQILQILANMLEQPGAERVTTASLAARLEVSEAALYRHFASKAQMFEGLIDLIETDVLALIDRAMASSAVGAGQAKAMVVALCEFAQKNPGMTRVIAGDALVFENERLVVRMNQFVERLQAQLHTCLKSGDAQAALRSSILSDFLMGRLQRYARSGFELKPTDQLEAALRMILG